MDQNLKRSIARLSLIVELSKDLDLDFTLKEMVYNITVSRLCVRDLSRKFEFAREKVK